MVRQYIDAAMRHAKYEVLPEDSTYYGEIVGFDGVYANAKTLEACRVELEEVLLFPRFAKGCEKGVHDGVLLSTT